MTIDKNLIDTISETPDGVHSLTLTKNGDKVELEVDGSPLALLFYTTAQAIEHLDGFDKGHIRNIYDTAKAYVKLQEVDEA